MGPRILYRQYWTHRQPARRLPAPPNPHRLPTLTRIRIRRMRARKPNPWLPWRLEYGQASARSGWPRCPGRPCPGIEYLSIVEDRPLPVEFDMCRLCYLRASVRRPISYLGSRTRVSNALRGIMRCKPERYYDTECRRFVLRVIDGLAKGKAERPARRRDNWATQYEWAIAGEHRDPAGAWVVERRFFLWHVPRRLQISGPLARYRSDPEARQ